MKNEVTELYYNCTKCNTKEKASGKRGRGMVLEWYETEATRERAGGKRGQGMVL